MKLHCVPFAILVCLFAVSSSKAITSRWNTNSSGNFNASANWDNGVPGANDVAYFGRGNAIAYTVTFRGNPLIQPTAHYVNSQLLIGPNTVTFVEANEPFLGPAPYTVNVSVTIGEPGSISVLNSRLPSFSGASVFVGAFTGSQSTLNVNAGNFRITGSQAGAELGIGFNSLGIMNIAAGAQVNVTGAEGNAVIGAVAGVSGTANVTGPGAAWNNSSDSPDSPLVIGSFGTGTLNILAGGHVNAHTSYIARESGSIGALTVDGPGSSWSNRGPLFVGHLGTGSLTVANGGWADGKDASIGYAALSSGIVRSGSGRVNVTDSGSRWDISGDLRVGVFLGTAVPGGDIIGVGELNISNGGQVEADGNAYVTGVASTGKISDLGSMLTIGGDLIIESGAALDIAAGAVVNSNSAFAGDRDGTVSVSDRATWNIPDVLTIGRGGDGTVQVRSAGRLNSRVALVGVRFGFFVQPHGLVEIDGAGSEWSGEQLFVGSDARGTVLVNQGGKVTSRTSHLGLLASGVGEVRISGAGSTWSNSENLYVGVAGTGDLQVANGGLVAVSGLLSIGPRGTLRGNSNIIANVNNGGFVAPGISPSFQLSDALGTLNLSGNYVQTAAGTLRIEIGSTSSFDKLAIDGAALLSGILDVSAVGGYTPTLGDTFEILTATGGVSGMFTSVRLPNVLVQQNLAWTVTYADDAVFLRVVIPGDFNANGVVDAADYILWRKNDGSQDGYNTWRANFGASLGSGALSSPAVPEPMSTSLFLSFAAIGIWRNCRGFIDRSSRQGYAVSLRSFGGLQRPLS